MDVSAWVTVRLPSCLDRTFTHHIRGFLTCSPHLYLQESRYFQFVLSFNPVYVRDVDSSTLSFSLSTHRPSFISLIFLVFSIHNKQFYSLRVTLLKYIPTQVHMYKHSNTPFRSRIQIHIFGIETPIHFLCSDSDSYSDSDFEFERPTLTSLVLSFFSSSENKRTPSSF